MSLTSISCQSAIVALITLAVCPHTAEIFSQDNRSRYDSLDSLIRGIRTVQNTPGIAVGVVRDGHIVYAKGFGLLDNRRKHDVTEESIFHIASVSKTLVAAAVLQLVEKGQLSLSTRIASVLPYFEVDGVKDKAITIRQLLSHTSGIPDDYDHDWNGTDQPDALEKYVRGLKGNTLNFDPGTRFEYSNRGYEILGDVVSKVSGMLFEDYIRANLLEPLGMTNSSFLMGPWGERILARPHTMDSVYNISPRSYPYNRAYGPSSTMHSSVMEMCRWMMTFLNHGEYDGSRILSGTSIDSMWAPAGKDFDNIGLCWFLGDYRGFRTVSHSGGDPGFASNLVLLPEKSVGVVVLANYDRAAVQPLTYAILDRILDLVPAEPVVRTQELDQVLYRSLEKGDASAVGEEFHRLKTIGPPFDFNQVRQLMALSAALKQQGRYGDAVIVDRLNVETFRPFAFLYANLGETCLAAHDTAGAISAYEKALKSNPSYQKARTRLSQLKK